MYLHAETISVTPHDNYCELNFDLPNILLDEHKYTIGVRTIDIEFSDLVSSSEFSLRSTVIDRNVFNPQQELYARRLRARSDYFFADVIIPKHYKIQLSHINAAEFKLYMLNAHLVQKIRIIFEILRDVRIQ